MDERDRHAVFVYDAGNLGQQYYHSYMIQRYPPFWERSVGEVTKQAQLAQIQRDF